ncbi:hypothetical protein DICPUDRAFT_4830, partial [Dictyostelium purpureum]
QGGYPQTGYPNQQQNTPPPPTNNTSPPPTNNQQQQQQYYNPYNTGGYPQQGGYPNQQQSTNAPPPTNINTAAPPPTNPPPTNINTATPPPTNINTTAPPTNATPTNAPPTNTTAPPMTNNYPSQPPTGSQSVSPSKQPQLNNYYQNTPPMTNTGYPQQPQQPQQSQPPQQSQQSQPQPYSINMSKVPSPTAILEQFNSYVYKTNSETSLAPPPSTVQQLIIDQQNASPNFIRSTLYSIPETEDSLNLIHIPFAIHIQPLAFNGVSGEIPTVRHPGGPIQCQRCHGYMNPFNPFNNGGKYFTCRLCEFENSVPQEYFSATLPNGLRTDFEMRPELQRGSVDFIKLEANPAGVPGYIFVIEVSQFTLNNGIVQNIIDSIKKILNEQYDNVPQRIGIITYDTEVHFWSFKPTYTYPQMKVLTHENVFVPIDEKDSGFLVDYRQSKHLMDFFFANYKTFFKRPAAMQAPFAFGAAVQAASMALEKTGGRVFTFNTVLPKGQPGAIPKRTERSVQPSPSSSFYKMVAQDCVAKNVSIDLFVIPMEICDVPSYAQLATTTGGHINLYQFYSADHHSEQLSSDIVHYVTMEYGFNATSKIRCSRGLTINGYFGNLTETTAGLVQMAGVTSDKSITAVIKYDDKLKPKSKAYIQFAMIYTNIRGETKIRVHNLRLSVDSVLANFFRDSDLDSITTYLARVASKEIVNSTTSTMVRSNTVDKGVELLASYRKNCASDKKATQLILPEGIKLMPIYILAMMKTPCFRLSNEISQDLRYFYINLYASSSPSRIIPLIYPRTYPIHNLLPGDGLRHPTQDHIVLPHFVRLSADQISQNGIYIVEDGRQIIVWVQQFAATNYLRDLFGIESTFGYTNSKLSQLYQGLNGQNEYHQRVEAIIHSITQLRGYRERPVIFVVQGDPIDAHLRLQFHEDKGVDSVSYIDFLCQIHKQI